MRDANICLAVLFDVMYTPQFWSEFLFAEWAQTVQAVSQEAGKNVTLFQRDMIFMTPRDRCVW